MAPFPSRRRTVFRYTDDRALAEAAAGAGVAHAYRLNSLYDPDYTGLGNQPMYFDQLVTSSGPYTKYRVFNTRVKVGFINYSSNPVVVGVYPSPSPTLPTSLKQAMEKPWGRYQLLTPVTGGSCKAVINARYNIADVFGLTRTHVANDEYFAGDSGSSPILGPYCVVWIWAGAGAVSAAGASVSVEFLFDAETYGLTNTATS